MGVPRDLLVISDLTVSLDGAKNVLENVSFQLDHGEVVGLIGPSGSGKSVLSKCILGLIPPQLIKGGVINFHSATGAIDMLQYKKAQHALGKEISMIFQEGKTALNPVIKSGKQIANILMKHKKIGSAIAKEQALSAMVELGLAKSTYSKYPHQLSGGEAQRIMFLLATICEPKLVIADEATSSLDKTNENLLVNRLKKLNNEKGTSILFISHDLELVKHLANRIVSIKNGRLSKEPSRNSQKLNSKEFRPLRGSEPILEVSNIGCGIKSDYDLLNRKPTKKIIDNVSFVVDERSILGIVGNSGSGKTSLSRCILQLFEHSGKSTFNGIHLEKLGKLSLQKIRKDIQIIFQDPFLSLNPKIRIKSAFLEAMKVYGIGENTSERILQITEMLNRTGIDADKLERFPHELSGGERQRICIARVMLLKPKLVILDEPVSSLDANARAGVINLLLDLKDQFELTYLFISHDLRLINFVADKVLVLEEGRIVEQGLTHEVLHNPKTDYTKSLMAGHNF
ncbi:MAG: ABC transporter ATP-binding protein [Cyclobacteriaceae bacterium]